MLRPLAFLALFAALIYGAAAYTRPQEPAGRALQNLLRTWCPTLARPELKPSYHRPSLRPLEIVPASATPYTPAELSEIYPTH